MFHFFFQIPDRPIFHLRLSVAKTQIKLWMLIIYTELTDTFDIPFHLR